MRILRNSLKEGKTADAVTPCPPYAQREERGEGDEYKEREGVRGRRRKRTNSWKRRFCYDSTDEETQGRLTKGQEGERVKTKKECGREGRKTVRERQS